LEWQDEGVLLRVRPHGETDAIASAFTFANGRHAGLVRGGVGRKARPMLQPGNRVQIVWKARLADQLGQVPGEILVGGGDGQQLRQVAAGGDQEAGLVALDVDLDQARRRHRFRSANATVRAP